jgi:hypothetical protein
MARVYFPSVTDFGVDVPWTIRLLVWECFLKKNPNNWFLIFREDKQWQAFEISHKLRKRGCLTAVHRYSDGTRAVYGATWRFEDEDS